MSDIPSEIITLVLVRLPVKSLLRFRCVSKPWRSLIDGQDFIKLHLHHSAETNSNRTLLVESSSFNILSFDLDSMKRLDTGNTGFHPGLVTSCCNGLVFLRPDSYRNNVVFLWNPSTRKVNDFPNAPLPRESGFWLERYAFGYDSKHSDYKVVRLVQDYHNMCLFSETKIFSLKTNSWKKALDFPYELIHCKTWGVYLNDAVHSVVELGNNDCSDVAIMAFDLAKEEHYEVPKPDISISSLEVIGGCLAAVVSGEKDMNSIWVMKEYGVKGSWCKLICIWRPVTLCPLAFSKSGDEVLLNYGGDCLIWYNLGTKKSNMVACSRGLSVFCDAMVIDVSSLTAWFCVESLVSPFSPCVVGIENQHMLSQGRRGKRDEEE